MPGKKKPQIYIPGQSSHIRIGPSKYTISRARDRIDIGGGGNPGIPAIDLRDYARRVNESIAQKQRRGKMFLGGTGKYEKFVGEGKYRTTLTKGMSRNPVNADFFLYHPAKTISNLFGWARNPIKRRAEQKGLQASIAARKAKIKIGGREVEVATEARTLAAQRQHETALRGRLRRVRRSYAALKNAYAEMGGGRISHEEFEIRRNNFLMLVKNFDEFVEKADKKYDNRMMQITTDLGKARKERKL